MTSQWNIYIQHIEIDYNIPHKDRNIKRVVNNNYILIQGLIYSTQSEEDIFIYGIGSVNQVTTIGFTQPAHLLRQRNLLPITMDDDISATVYDPRPIPHIRLWSFWCWYDDVIKWKHFLRYWPFVRGIHRSPVNSPHKGQWRGALMFFDLRLDKRLSKQSRSWWFETPSRPLWHHCNETETFQEKLINVIHVAADTCPGDASSHGIDWVG